MDSLKRLNLALGSPAARTAFACVFIAAGVLSGLAAEQWVIGALLIIVGVMFATTALSSGMSSRKGRQGELMGENAQNQGYLAAKATQQHTSRSMGPSAF